MIQQAARDFAQRELIKDVIERDHNALFPTEHVKTMAELGFLGMTVDTKYDGGGMDTISYVLAVEELSKVDASASVIVSVNNSLVCYGLEKFGTEEQKNKFLKPLARGEKLGAFLLSEPEAGSDATSQRTTAEDKGDYYLVNGTKNWITNANSASTYIVITQTNPAKKHKGITAFIIEKNSPGITLGPHEDKMGMRSSDTHSVMFNDVKVPKENRIGAEGFGFTFAMKVLEGGRIGIAAQALGLASGALERATAYAKERKAFGKPIFAFQNTRFKLAECQALLMASRTLVDACIVAHLKGELGIDRAALTKYWITDNQCKLVDECLQLFGGYGYMKEYPIARLYADARVQRIYGGTNEIMKELASRFL